MQSKSINLVDYVCFLEHQIVQRSFPSPLMGTQISARVSMESRYRHLLPSLVSETQIFSVLVSSLRLRFFSLGLVIETHTFAVSVSSLRLTSFQSRSRHWDLDISVLVSLLRLRHIQSRSRHWDSDLFSLGLDDPNLVLLIFWSMMVCDLLVERKQGETSLSCFIWGYEDTRRARSQFLLKQIFVCCHAIPKRFW